MLTPASLEKGNQIALLKTLGIRLLEIGARYAVMAVTVDERHLNYLGGAHGGLLATLIDTVAFFPQPLLPSGTICATTALNVSYITPAGPGDTLTARSELLHIGRRTASVTVRISNQDARLVAHGTVSLLILGEPATGDRSPMPFRPDQT
jgi:acyl-CoA thioesterase